MPKTIAIGDIHGHFDQFNSLMYTLFNREDINPEEDIFVFLGDYVDGGPDTKKVLDKLMQFKEQFPHWKFLFGNHESLLLDALSDKRSIYGDYYLWWNQGGKETLNSFVPEGGEEFSEFEKAVMQPKDLITGKYVDFMKELDLYYENDDYFFVHGGLYPDRSIEAHKEAVGPFHPDLMTEGSMDYDMIWMRDPFIGSDFDWGKKIIFGHTCFPWSTFRAQDEYGDIARPGYAYVADNKIGIDTMQHNSGRLTALILPEEELVYSEFS